MWGLSFWGFQKEILKNHKNTNYFSTFWNHPKPWKPASKQSELFNLISKSYIITVLKCKVMTKTHEKRGLQAISPGLERSQQKSTRIRELFLSLIQSPPLENNTHFSDWGQDFRLTCCEACTQRIWIVESIQIRKSRETCCSSSAPHLPLKIERPRQVKAVK